MVLMRSMSPIAFDQILKLLEISALIFIGSACRSETKPECISPQIERQWARDCLIFRQKPRLWRDLVKELADRQRVPDADALISEAGHEDGRRKQKDLGSGVGVVGSDGISSKSILASFVMSQPRNDHDE